MKYLSNLILLLLGVPVAYAQNPRLDSLNRLIQQATSDTARINRMNTKLMELAEYNIDSALSLGLRTIKDASRIRYKKGEAFARTRLAIAYNVKGNFPAAETNLKIAESIYSGLQDFPGLLKVYNTYGIMYGMQSKYDSSIAFLEKGIKVAERLDSKKELGNLYLNIGISYNMLSNQLKSLQYQQKALNLAEATNNLNSQAYCLVNMANSYKVMGDNIRAEQRYLRAIKIAQQKGIKNVELYAYANLSEVYGLLNDIQKSYDTAIKAVNLSKEMGDDGMQATSLAKAAMNLAKQQKFPEAEKLAKQAMAIADSSQQPLNIHQTYSAMGGILKMEHRYAAAIPYYETSFAALKNADIYDSQTGDAYKDLSECYEKTGNYRLALSNFKKATTIADSVMGKEQIRKATELAMTYEFEKREQAAQAEQQKQNAIAKARQLTLLAGLGLMVLLASVSFYAYRTKQKANTLLQSQKHQLEEQKELLELQKQQLETTLAELKSTQRQLLQAEKMATMGKLTKGIVDRILNPLNYINNFALVAKELLGELKGVIQKHEGNFPKRDQEDWEDASTMLDQNLIKINEHGTSTARILQDMQKLLKERSSMIVNTDINQFLEERVSMALQKTSLTASPALPVELTFELAHQPLEVSLLPQEFNQVLTSLVDNSYYSLQEKSRRVPGFVPEIRVATQICGDHVRIEIRDNGKGIGAKEQDQLFSPFFTTKPTAKGTGLGLYMSRDIVEYLQGHMTLESKEGEFAQITITLPLVSVPENVVADEPLA
ncbi:tetratricopeptide repeat-containing sensor histidine kinase [Spirosoma koreense]